MKKVIMHKWQACRTGRWGWSIEEVWDDWNHIYSDPYYVEIPDDFSLGDSATHEKMYFKDGCNIGYKVTNFNESEHCCPYLVGGSPVEQIRLTVLAPVES